MSTYMVTTSAAATTTTMVAVEEEQRRKKVILLNHKKNKKEFGMKKADLEGLVGATVKITDAFGQSAKGVVESINDSTIVLLNKNLKKIFMALDFVSKLKVI